MVNRRYVAVFLAVLLPLLLALAAILFQLIRSESGVQEALARSNQQHVIQRGSQWIQNELSRLRGDVLILAEHSSLQSWLSTMSATELASLEDDLYAFARHRQLYDQVRFIDSSGKERVRIDREGELLRKVPVEALQNKSTRYYVKETLRLDQGEVYVSPFDLNVEYGELEQPLNPVIRFSAPVYDRQQRVRGLVVVNYLGNRLLQRLRDLADHGRGQEQVWLLNPDGYWILGPDPTKEWGFMYPARHDVSFAREYPKHWARVLSQGDTGQWELEGGLFTYQRFSRSIFSLGENPGSWTLISYVPIPTVGERMDVYISAFGLLGLLLVFVSGLVAYKDQQRYLNEQRTRESEARFRGLLDAEPDAVVIVNSHGTIRLVNEQTERLFGYDRLTLVGQVVEKLVPERFREQHVHNRMSYEQYPVTRPMGIGMDLYGVRSDGSEFPVEISLSPVETGQEWLVISTIRDITQRKHLEGIRERMQARFKSLVNNLPVGVYRHAMDGDGRFIEVNPAMVEMMEAETVSDLLKRSMSELHSDSQQQRKLAERLNEKGEVNEELHLKTLRGKGLDAAISAVRKRDEETGEVYVDGIIEDITQRKEAREQIQLLNQSLRERSLELESSNRELEAFSYSVSHDLRAPLRAIDGFSRTLIEEYSEALDSRGRDRLSRVRGAAQRMGTLIDDLLKLSRVSRAEMRHDLVDLSQLAREVLCRLEEEDRPRQVEFRIADALYTRGDAQLLKVVFDNLIGNAWKFTRDTENPLIEVGGDQTDPSLPVFYVRDNGAGFDMAYSDKLFTAFQRLHDFDEYPGTGIGLATVNRIVRKHGGRIWAEGKVNEGACFFFTLGQAE